MRKFLKLLVSIIVICTIGFTLYFLLSKVPQFDSPNGSGDFENNKDNQEELSGEVKKSGDNDIIVDTFHSGENLEAENINRIIANADNIRAQNNSTSVINTFNDNVGVDIIGTRYTDFFTEFNTTEMSTTIQVAGTMIYIIPAPDFINISQYHYDENGNLLLYVDELIGVGGEIRYYFSDDNLIATQTQIEEEITINYEEAEEIIQRAKVIYDKYRNS